MRKGSTGNRYKQRACIPIEERFWAKVDMRGPMRSPYLGPCWVWTAARSTSGYGQLGRGRSGEGWVPAHRLAYELMIGPIPEGLQLDHLCRVRHCVNPAHLEPVTCAENLRRGIGGLASLEKAREIARTKTHCKNGHAFTPENVRMYRDHRQCRACQREFAQRKRDRLRAEHVLDEATRGYEWDALILGDDR